MDDQDNKTGSGAQSRAPVAGRPLTAEDVALLRSGDLLMYTPEIGRAELVQLRRNYRGGLAVQSVRDPDCGHGDSFDRFTFIGRPDREGWIFNSEGWAENPVPGATIEYRCRSGSTWALPVSVPSDALRWGNSGWSGDIIAFRLPRPASDQPVEAIGAGRDYPAEFEAWWATYKHRNRDVADYSVKKQIAFDAFYFAALSPASPARTPMGGWPEVTDQWAETYCELTGRDPDGQQVTFVDGGTVTTFRDMAKLEIEAMLCAAPKSAVRAIATPTPMGGEVEALREAKVKPDLDDMRQRAKYLRGYADIVSKKMYRGERPSGIWNLERAALLLDRAAEALAASSPSPAQSGPWLQMVHELRHPDAQRTGWQNNADLMRAAADEIERLAASPQPEAGEAVVLDDVQQTAIQRAAMDANCRAWRFARLAMVEDGKVVGYPAFSRADMAELARLAPPSVQPVEGK